jgi:hypothetical protein
MKHVLAPITLGIAALTLVVACGGSAASPSSSETTASARPSASVADPGLASPASDATAPSDPGASPSGAVIPPVSPIFDRHADQALEDQLPTAVSGPALQRYSMTMTELLDAGGDRASVDAFLQTMGKTEADGSLAGALDPTNTLGGGIFAFKVNGADPATLLAGITALETSDLGTDATTNEATVGGKNVTVVSIGTGANDTVWIFGRGDVVFVVHASDEVHAAAFLQAIS